MDISNTTYKIRKIAPLDDDRVKEIILTVMADYGCIGEGYSSSDPEVQTMYEVYTNDQSAFFVIEDDKGLVYGCGGIGPLAGGDNSICELKKMYFLPELRGKGLGQLMMDRCMEAANVCGYTQCYLETLVAMEAANHLYHKNGFKKLEVNMGNTGHSGCDAFFVKDLSLK